MGGRDQRGCRHGHLSIYVIPSRPGGMVSYSRCLTSA
jgi:hypothetical protein